MPDKTVHPVNPVHVDEWAKLSDARDFYVIQHGTVGHARTTRIYEVSNQHGSPVKARETGLGDGLTEGAIVSAKTFGPGADLQRLVDLGAIRPASKWEADAVAAELAKVSKPDGYGATPAATPVAESVKVEPIKPIEPVKAEPVKAEPPKVVEAEKK